MAEARAATGDAERVNPAAYTLVHAVGGKRTELFPPTRLMNAVTYIGRIAGNDVVLDSTNVSRRHAKLVVNESGVTVHDLDSHNGIFLNGKKVRSTPVVPGDLLYVGDVCIEVKKNDDADGFLGAGLTRVQHSDITGEEDPGVRNLATLLRAADLSATADAETYPIEIIELCRELTEASVAVLVTGGTGNRFETPVVLQPESGRRGDVPIPWVLIQKVFDDALPIYSADAKRRPPVPGEKIEGGVMCVPIVIDGRTQAAIYLSRPMAGPVFSERELETVVGIAQLMVLRERGAHGGGGMPAASSGDDATALAAQAKVEAAELRLQEAQTDIRSLTERTHALEADNLKLRQGVELEKQNAIEAKREADRARVEATKLDQGLHKTDEEAKKLKDAIHRLEEERAKLRENVRGLDEERKARTTDLTKLKDAQKALEAERQRLEAELDALRRESTDAASQIMRLQQEMQQASEAAEKARLNLQQEMGVVTAQREALRSAMRQTLPPTVAEHVEHSMEGGSLITDAVPRQVAALYLELFGLDAWATKAPAADVKARLDRFCAAVALRTRANGGRIEQVLGHAHLVSFGADPPSVRAAIRCGLEVGALLREEGVVCGLHVGTTVSGFFGEGDSATRVEVGEAPAIARALAQLAHTPTFYASETVHKAVGADPAFALAMVGPARTPHGSTLLFTVDAAEVGGPQ